MEINNLVKACTFHNTVPLYVHKWENMFVYLCRKFLGKRTKEERTESSSHIRPTNRRIRPDKAGNYIFFLQIAQNQQYKMAVNVSHVAIFNPY